MRRLLLWLLRCDGCKQRMTSPGCRPVGLGRLADGGRPLTHIVYRGNTRDA